jgi:diaminohydroxyphosphoribosylaminopyrimidine deaminase / 5-amino-6-(5-phosphoribosylamino)uracil reductase
MSKNEIFITIKYAQSLDGKVATKNFDSKWISNSLCLEFAHKLRNENDAILVGINTVIFDNPTLNVRLENQQNIKNPIRVILDKDLKISIDSNIVKTSKYIKTVIFYNEEKLDMENEKILEKIKILKSEYIELINVSLKNNFLDLLEILSYLKNTLNVKSLLVEGGGKIITEFYKNGLFDKIFVIVAPIFIGNEGISAINNLDFCSMNEVKNQNLKLSSIKILDDNVVWELERK